jgi:taurine dioxygenase
MKTETSQIPIEHKANLDLLPVTAHIGADVLNLRLADAMAQDDDQVFHSLRRALEEFLVLRLRKQYLSPEQMERFGLRFGGPLLNLKRTFLPAKHLPGLEYLKIISNVQTPEGIPLGDGSSAAQDWHSDGAMKPKTSTYTYFYARTVPEVPPKTYWMNTYLVFESLPHELKARVAGLKVIHHDVGAGNEFPLPPSLPLEKRLVGPQHPLVRLHPSTRRPILYLPHRDDALVVGWSPEDSLELISSLRRFAAQSQFFWGVALEANDFVMWDNRPTLHRRDGWDATVPRVVWHLANEGEEPIPFVEPNA